MAKHTRRGRRKRAKAIRFKDTTSRWGSCTSDGKLSFSWRIMMAPPPVIDYLVAHEVAHLKEMNHGPKFWKLCEELCPDTRALQGLAEAQWQRAAGDRVRVSATRSDGEARLLPQFSMRYMPLPCRSTSRSAG